MKTLENKYIDILKEELILAEGCTEPIAIAYACAVASSYLKSKPTKIELELSANMIKNVDGVVVPNSGGLIGAEVAAILGTFYGKKEKDLLVISDISENQIQEFNKLYYKSGICTKKKIENGIKLYILARISNDEDIIEVEIKHVHTNITKILKNNKVIMSRICNDGDFNSPLSSRSILNVEDIYKFVQNLKIDQELEKLLKLTIINNEKIAHEGLNNDYGLNVGSIIRKNMNEKANTCVRSLVPSFAAAGSDARMSGSSLPVMTVTGSGNQGLTATLGIIEYAKLNKISKEKLYKSLILSLLTTIHIKTNIGRLSAYCGVICASAASAGGFAYLMDGDLKKISSAINVTLADLSGVLCDGAKSTCSLKISSGITSALDASYIAMDNRNASSVGFLGSTVEETIENIGKIASDGMRQSDDIVVNLMMDRKEITNN